MAFPRLFGFGRRPSLTSRPRTPFPHLVYAIGDIHGELRLLERLLAAIEADAALRPELEPTLVVLGDFVDRGPDSRAVLERLMAGGLPNFRCHVLMGNHEAALLDFLADPARGSQWLAYGGVQTLASYGIRASVGTADPARCLALAEALAARLTAGELAFLRGLPLSLELGDFLFVHAGIRPGRALDAQTVADMLNIREQFLCSTRDHGKVIVHGHSISERVEIQPNRIGVDTGAYATGILSAVVLAPDQDVRILSNPQ